MFARRVYMHLKPNSVAEFTQRLEKDVLSPTSKAEGFQDEMTFVGPSGKEAIRDQCVGTKPRMPRPTNRATYPQVAKILASVIEGAPQIETFDVANSTFHRSLPP